MNKVLRFLKTQGRDIHNCSVKVRNIIDLNKTSCTIFTGFLILEKTPHSVKLNADKVLRFLILEKTQGRDIQIVLTVRDILIVLTDRDILIVC